MNDTRQGTLHYPSTLRVAPSPSPEEDFFLILECPRVLPGMPTSGSRIGCLVACAKCDQAVFRDDSWDATCDAIRTKCTERGQPGPPFEVWCYECQRKATAEREAAKSGQR